MNTIRWETKETYSYGRGIYGYILSSLENKPINYKTGQFLTVVLDYDGKFIRRAYPIYTVPGLDEAIGILVRCDADHAIEKFVHETWEPGTHILSYPPAGVMEVEETTEEGRMVIIIAEHPFSASVLPIVKHVLHFEPDSHVHLMYQSSNEIEVLFKNELTQLKKKFEMKFRWNGFYTNPIPNPPYSITATPLTIDNLAKLLKDYDPADPGTQVFILGSNIFTNMCVVAARTMGYRLDILRWQLFDPDLVGGHKDMEFESAYNIRVCYGAQSFEFKSCPDETILHTIMHNDFDLPYSCKGGTCGECAVIVRKGKFIMTKNDVLKTKDLNDKYVLLCTCFAKSDMELWYPNYAYREIGDKLMWD